jgi:hypothetical protein
MSLDLDDYKKDKLNLFLLKLNANEFDYNLLIENLIDPVISYSVSRQIQDEYKKMPGRLTKKAKERFVDYCRNTGELGELLLYAFLECDMNAPKILTKLELKTSTSMYVNGADGVHYLKLPNGNYQLIFGESKTICDPTDAIKRAFTSIYEFKNEINGKGDKKSGLNYEKSLISDNLVKETFSDEDQAFLKSLIYPKKDNKFNVDDAFGIFIGYEIEIADDKKAMGNQEFREFVKQQVCSQIQDKIQTIRDKIIEYRLQGYNFYIYILPFTDLDEKKKFVLEGLIK